MKKPYVYKPKYCRDSIKRDPVFARVTCELADGFKVLSGHDTDASVELQGFCIPTRRSRNQKVDEP